MPQIIVTTDAKSEQGEPPVMFKERVNPSDFESDHFTGHLMERLGWAVVDAQQADAHADGR